MKGQVSEGSGLRVWALAEGLRKNGIKVTIAVPKPYFSPEVSECVAYEGVDDLIRTCQSSDAVIAPYSTLFTKDLFESLPNRVLRISDSYVPIHAEISARNFNDDDDTIKSFENLSQTFLDTLALAHVLLVANEAQRNYYLGMLFALKKVNPMNFDKVAILMCPIGVSELNEASVIKTQKSHKTLLWWGAFYPWFDFQKFAEIAEILESRGSKIKIEVIGAMNPYVGEASFIKPARAAIERLKQLKNVEIIEWLPAEQIETEFKKVDLAICLNKPSSETQLSWRTRFVNLVEMGMPLATDGSDPFGEEILEAGGGFRLTGTAEEMAEKLENLNFVEIQSAKTNLKKVANKFSLQQASEPLAKYLKTENPYRMAIRLNKPVRTVLGFSKQHSRALFGENLMKQFEMFMDHTSKFGFKSAVMKVVRLHLRFPTKQKKQDSKSGNPLDIMLMHQIDITGAPLVGIELCRTMASTPGHEVKMITPTIDDSEVMSEQFDGSFEVEIQNPKRKLRLPSDLNSIGVNSCAVPRNWIVEVLNTKKRIPRLKVALFLHENEPSIYIDKELALRLLEAQDLGLKIYVGSEQTRENLLNLYGLGLKGSLAKWPISSAPQIDLEKKTDAIRVCLVGNTGDNRKRHLDTITAVAMAQTAARSSNVSRRDIELVLIGVGDNFFGREVTRIANQSLQKGSFELFGKLGRLDCLREISACNVAVSLSDNESFALYIAEAMSSGAIVLRTPVGGSEETVSHDFNGWSINTISELTQRLLLLSDRTQTSDERLIQMMQNSKDKIGPWLAGGHSEVVNDFLNTGVNIQS